MDDRAFAFTATGATPTAFSLSDGQQQILTTGPLSATPIPVTVTESLVPGFDPAAELDCVTVDGGPARVTVNPVTRTLVVPLDVRQSRVTCTVTNKRHARISVIKTAVGGDAAFP